MADNSKAPAKGKPNLPAKPYADFPLFAHQTGRWAKKVRQKLRFYGRWGRTVSGEVIPVEDGEKAASDALAEFQRCWPYHSQGREAPDTDDGAFLTLRALANRFLGAKESRVESGELSRTSFEDYYRTCEMLISHFGRQRRVDALTPEDFEGLRKAMATGCNLTTLRNKVNHARIVFKFAFDSRLIDRPVNFGQSFDRPSRMRLRATRELAGKKLFSREEVLLILAALDGHPIVIEGKSKPVTWPRSSVMRAMVLLGLNGGFGNTDCASLPQTAVDLKTGWLEFPRPKTAIKRRIPLWPETVAAIREAISVRPAAIDPDDSGLCFLTERGTRFVRVQASKQSEHRIVVINSLARRFEQLLDAIKVGQRKGIGFYTFRHVFETIGGDSKDQVAVDSIMGHTDNTMAATYREEVADERLLAVTNHVRSWLWPGQREAK
ncbi:tyrosine-type recombinase/integrase [Schlesneria paludicola]|uniref:tyrosine-type recombinase/integrase n=1 Tax=Schlesneria paludicola TaxID=360056 RepID=UPI00029B3DBB|nr:site-specific integrase [Schlesneria paludicola]